MLFPVHPGVCLSPRCTEPPRSHRRWFQAAGCAECRRTRRPQRGLWAVLYFLEGNSTRIKREKGQDRIMCNYCHCVTKPNTFTHLRVRKQTSESVCRESSYLGSILQMVTHSGGQVQHQSVEHKFFTKWVKIKIEGFRQTVPSQGTHTSFFWLWHGLQPRPRRPLIAHG